MNFKRKEKYSASTPEDASQIQERLSENNSEVETLQAELEDLISRKRNGSLHDGEYNISVSYIGQRLDTLKKERSDLLHRIESVQSNLARRALGQ